jgi:hypothetical protein
MISAQIELEGLERLVARLAAAGTLGPVLTEAFETIGTHAAAEAQAAAPHDRGKLRQAIIHEVDKPDKAGIPGGVRIGTIGAAKPNYAAWMEFGTGRVNDHPSWPKKTHRLGAVAIDAINEWGRRTGKSAARAIASIRKYGGLKPRRYLRDTLAANQDRYIRVVRVEIGRVALG